MNVLLNNRSRWLMVVIYAIAMAWVESALVFDLRTMVNRIDPYQPDPLPMIGSLGHVELVREAATVAMLLTVGILAGRTWRSRLGYFAMAFGVWDIFYYVFLKVICGWPYSLLNWDILFLLPMPWWGPVWAPMSIALLLIAWGTLASQFEAVEQLGSTQWRIVAMNSLGIALALYVFMADSIRVAHGGTPALRTMLPTTFNWPLFSIALVLMASPVIQKVISVSRSQERSGASGRYLCAVPPHPGPLPPAAIGQFQVLNIFENWKPFPLSPLAALSRRRSGSGRRRAGVRGMRLCSSFRGRERGRRRIVCFEGFMAAVVNGDVNQISVLLRGDAGSLRGWLDRSEARRLGFCVGVVVVGAGLYGAAMGWWRSPVQGLFVALKFPLIILLTTIGNGLLNAMLAPLLGLNISLRQSFMAILMSFTIASAILGSFSPLAAFLIWNAPPLLAHSSLSEATYNVIQLAHVVVIAFAGITANVHLLRLLTSLSGDRTVAVRVLLGWVAGNLFLGSQLCWILRPFIGAPGLEVEFLRKTAFQGNFYETVLRGISELFK